MGRFSLDSHAGAGLREGDATLMHIYCGNIVWRDMSARHGQCMTELALLCRERGIEFTNGTVYGDSLVSRARSVAASEFLRSDADVLLTIDSDILFDPEDAIALCEETVTHDIIGGVYLKRSEHPIPSMPLPDAGVVFDSAHQPVEVRYVSTGFAATSRRVFEALAPHVPLCMQHEESGGWWYFYQPMVVPDKTATFLPLSEDWALCHRAKEFGFSSWIDPRIRLVHLSQTGLTLEDMARAPRPAPQPMKLRPRDGSIEVALQTPVEA